MTTLVLDRRDLMLELQPGRLRIRVPQENPRDVPLALLERVVIHSRTLLDTAVLGALAEAGVAVLVLSPRRHQRVAVLLGRAHNDLATRLAQAERLRDAEWCLYWSRRLVRAKLRGQIHFNRSALAIRPDERRVLQRSHDSLQRIRERLPCAPDLPSLRGLEGAAAAAHFQALGAVLPPALGFKGRNRRPPRDPANAILSLAYTLLHFEAVRAGHAAGLDPYIGFYHRPSFARASLASDLIEPLRPWLDQHLWRLLAERVLRPEHFTLDRGACLLNKAGRERFYPCHETLIRPARRALRRSTRHLAAAL
ncbi:MAG TPA: CRISPR-associated endonuclease Cas1, partial [Gammaproteobacteria bacterium]|nr:CRISPR-associated endonuclease Cas1 [Gammaproteobacteria bacterium]MCH78210.1 CRISPR-associated endonuclease Cas1 [Gammaproteobacteria bacterium]